MSIKLGVVRVKEQLTIKDYDVVVKDVSNWLKFIETTNLLTLICLWDGTHKTVLTIFKFWLFTTYLFFMATFYLSTSPPS